MEKRLRFKREQRLHKKKAVDQLFREGHTFTTPLLRLHYRPWAAKAYHQVVIAVRKRDIRKSTDRNRLRRRIRESYRQRQHDYAPAFLGKAYHLAFRSRATPMVPSFQEIERAVVTLLERLKRHCCPPSSTQATTGFRK